MGELIDYVIIVLACVLCFVIGMFLVSNDIKSRHDYLIDLKYNKIEVTRLEEGDVITIEPDSLMSFIEKDNL